MNHEVDESVRNWSETDPERICFVICPIGSPNSETRERSDLVYEYIVKPAAEENGLVTFRSDKIDKPGLITSQIISHMLNDRVVVADLTDRNPNVFYELGLRHSFRKPVVQLIQSGQSIPFDVYGERTIYYDTTLPGAIKAKNKVRDHIRATLQPNFVVDSPVAVAARLDEMKRTTADDVKVVYQNIVDHLQILDKRMVDIGKGLMNYGNKLSSSDDMRDFLPSAIKDKLELILKRYAEEIDLLKSIRFAGITGVYKRREAALASFARALDEESHDIIVVGSSLKGLLKLPEYKEVAEKLRFKAKIPGTNVKFLLTHPLVADLRARQERRGLTEIGEEIIQSLTELESWGIPAENVRLYLGTPTCFGIMTRRQMLINPYPYGSESYNSPCLTLELSPEGGAERIGYFYDEFKSRHFGAWDTDSSVKILNYKDTIKKLRSMLPEYARLVEELLNRGSECS